MEKHGPMKLWEAKRATFRRSVKASTAWLDLCALQQINLAFEGLVGGMVTVFGFERQLKGHGKCGRWSLPTGRGASSEVFEADEASLRVLLQGLQQSKQRGGLARCPRPGLLSEGTNTSDFRGQASC